jgi:hypothetical protein
MANRYGMAFGRMSPGLVPNNQTYQHWNPGPDVAGQGRAAVETRT